MKNIFLLVIAVLSGTISFSQDSTIELSKFEQFIGRSGKIFKTEVRELGEIRSTIIDKVKATDLSTDTSCSAVRVHPGFRDPGLSHVAIVFIMKNELDSVINVLNFFAKQIARGRVDEVLSYNYITAGDVKITCTNDEGGWTVTIGRIYKQLRTNVPSSTYSYGRRNIDELIELFKQARE